MTIIKIFIAFLCKYNLMNLFDLLIKIRTILKKRKKNGCVFFKFQLQNVLYFAEKTSEVQYFIHFAKKQFIARHF